MVPKKCLYCFNCYSSDYKSLSIYNANIFDALKVADFILMFHYAQNMSDFYLQLEDDVECANNFVPVIESFIKEQNEQTRANGSSWAMLEFCELGFIGKLFRLLLLFVEYITSTVLGTSSSFERSKRDEMNISGTV